MNNDRVKELQDISNEFLRKLGEKNEIDLSIKQPLKTEINEYTNIRSNNSNMRKLNMPNFSLTRYKKQKEKKESLVKINY